ncbi:uromodulin-like [Saccostrea cucullata]|uniref:uromodulin-like n=1 Tax=Saccostrea cuccullata TaxID=36930 RepID=UPI002ED0E732
MATYKVLMFITLCGATGSISPCNDVSDICSSANSSTLPEDYSRSQNCIYNSTYKLSDQNLNQQWYKSNISMPTRCPGLLECGAVYPLWLNGTIPEESDGAVNRTVCRRGRTHCCEKTYDIRIQNCSSFIAYCLLPVTERDERYCFGQNGTCLAPPTPKTNSSSQNGEGLWRIIHYNTGCKFIVSLKYVIMIMKLLLKYFTL